MGGADVEKDAAGGCMGCNYRSQISSVVVAKAIVAQWQSTPYFGRGM